MSAKNYRGREEGHVNDENEKEEQSRKPDHDP
jgi:hypothetical protein